MKICDQNKERFRRCGGLALLLHLLENEPRSEYGGGIGGRVVEEMARLFCNAVYTAEKNQRVALKLRADLRLLDICRMCERYISNVLSRSSFSRALFM